MCTKVSFCDEKNAEFYIKKLKKTSNRETIPVRAYLCDKCLAWHLTSRPDKYEEKIKAYLEELTNLRKKCTEYKLEINRLISIVAEKNNL